jgi:hypothetical protein
MHLVSTGQARNREDLPSPPFVMKYSLDEHRLVKLIGDTCHFTLDKSIHSRS